MTCSSKAGKNSAGYRRYKKPGGIRRDLQTAIALDREFALAYACATIIAYYHLDAYQELGPVLP